MKIKKKKSKANIKLLQTNSKICESKRRKYRKSQNGTFLEKEYSKLHSVPKESVLEYFLNKKKLKSLKKKRLI